jgi:nucleotide-binding universal stress UspA family protein
VSTDARFRIAIGVDGSKLSELALAWAITEGRLRRATVRVMTAWEYPAVVAGMEGVLDDSNVEVAARHTQAVVLGRVPHEDVDVTAEVVHGSGSAVLIDASKQADLVVVGSRGYGGFAGLLLGSTSTQVVHHAACTVMVVRDRRH